MALQGLEGQGAFDQRYLGFAKGHATGGGQMGFTGLSEYSQQNELCEEALKRLSERSPTALVFTLNLLRQNEGRPIEGVFRADLKAARFIYRRTKNR